MKQLLLFLSIFSSISATAQTVNQPDSLQTAGHEHVVKKTETISLLLYNRLIIDAKGNIRTDQNIVPTFRLNKLLKLQIGFRLGERPHNLNSYYHYKVELQTKQFWNTLRFIARMSTNVIESTGPDLGDPYTRSNYLGVAEVKYPLSKRFLFAGGLGYLYSFKKANYLEGAPVADGIQNNHLIYKAAIHYEFSPRGYVGVAFGTYDVFNPYNLNEPFAQVDCEYDFSERATLYTYYRYQEAGHFNEPLNSFICTGIRLHFYKK